MAASDDRADPLLSTRVVGETVRTGSDLQEQARYGGPPAETAPAARGSGGRAAGGERRG
ncbi:hypothetical protein ABZ960_32240 [Streptomyces pseudovenezuelae]|uniref:hypothetical protein n=1 Tax=Streptomyces pseudovenezuelae TaxID=67350 RepID=UPI0034A16D55